MTFDSTKPCRTRSGLEVELFSRRLEKASQPLIGIIRHPSGVECLHHWSLDGFFMPGPSNPHEYDIENIPEHKTLWVNLYQNPPTELPFLGCLRTEQIRNDINSASLEFIFDGETLLEVKIHHNLEKVLQDKIPF